ncbi:MAG: alpha-amylase, partial [Chloroflexi bacterium]|nr:alpha-amylase [Chloroflexota bacterium]
MNLSPRMEFHISRQARDRYAFDQTLFSITGNVVFANFHAARVFAEKMNAQRDLVHFPEQAVSAGQLNAMGLIDEISHRIISLYRAQINPNVTQELLAWLETRLGGAAVDKALALFCDQFPPVAVYQRETDAAAYLQEETEGVPNRQIAVEEMLVLWISNANPAFAPFRELFDDAALKKRTAYPKIITEIQAFLDNQPNF